MQPKSVGKNAFSNCMHWEFIAVASNTDRTNLVDVNILFRCNNKYRGTLIPLLLNHNIVESVQFKFVNVDDV